MTTLLSAFLILAAPSSSIFAAPTQEGKAMDAGWCSLHGVWTDSNECPGCRTGRTSNDTGLSAEELKNLRRAAEEAVAKARTEAEKARVREELADIDAALEDARERARRIRIESDLLAAENAKKASGAAFGHQLIDNILRSVHSRAVENDLRFQKNDKDSARVDSSRQEPLKLAGDSGRPLEFIVILPSPSPDKPPADHETREWRLKAAEALKRLKERESAPKER